MMRRIRLLFLRLVLAMLAGLLVNAIGPAVVSRLLALVAGETRTVGAIVETLFPLVGYLLIIGGVLFAVTAELEPLVNVLRPIRLRVHGVDLDLAEELTQARARVQAEPEKVKPAWDLGRVKLEVYVNRNLSQIAYIFWLSVAVMTVGFVFILFGISRALSPGTMMAAAGGATVGGVTLAVVSTVAGIITEFIGATFLILYRSTIQQAAGYTKALERINAVGMAMQILDTLSGESRELQDRTKAEIVKLLLIHGETDPEPKGTKGPSCIGNISTRRRSPQRRPLSP
jgi:hypothetical protein